MTPDLPAASSDVARALAAAIRPLDEAAIAEAARRLDNLTKPPGSLGRLETLAIQLAGIQGHVVTSIEWPAIAVFAGDHGITRQGISAYPSEVTRQMLANFAAGGAAINVLARAAGARLVVVDVGVAGEPLPGDAGTGGGAQVIDARIAPGTRDFSLEPAMTADEALAALDVGRRIVDDLAAQGCDLLAVGEMGIGNTTASSAIVAALTRSRAMAVTGRGTGLDAAGVEHKAAVIDAALALHALDPDRPLDVLAAVGGLEIAALSGAVLAGGRPRRSLSSSTDSSPGRRPCLHRDWPPAPSPAA